MKKRVTNHPIDILLSPFNKFVKSQSAGGILLFAATIVALIWANSPFAQNYTDLWSYKIGISTDSFELVKPLSLWVNDGLMAVFFFMIGLEIKRELLIGELDDLKKASLPIFAAIGGMILPVCLFLILNQQEDTVHGWGIPMATDIAFSLAILKLLGKRIPLGLKVFLTAFAIIDDLGAVIVIALFYSEGIHWNLLLIASIPIVLLFLLAHKGIFNKYLHLTLGVGVWLLFLKSGVHPTIAGVLLALSIPVRQKLHLSKFNTKLAYHLEGLKESKRDKSPLLSRKQMAHVNAIDGLTEKVYSPLQHLEEKLHSWVAFFIMPIFALANAGVAFGIDMHLDWPLVIHISIALILGKSIGISLLSYIGIKLKIAKLPEGTNMMQILAISVLAGVGFTMSIFIANLAFESNAIYIDSAKIGVILGSLVSGILAYFLLLYSSPKSKSKKS